MTSPLCSFVLVLIFCALETSSTKSFYAAEGSDVTLPCNHTYDRTYAREQFSIKWFVFKSSYQLIAYHNDMYDSLIDRVRYTSTDPRSGDASITISNLRLSDTGTYYCNLIVISETYAQKIDLKVTKKPSKPECSVEWEFAEVYGARLKCRSSHDTLTLTYSWTKMDGNKMLPPQANVDATMGHLFVDTITEDDCGTYLCTVESLVGTQHCDVLLECPQPPLPPPPPITSEKVQPTAPPSATSDGGIVPVVAVTSVMLVLGVGALAAIWYWCRRNSVDLVFNQTVEEVPMSSMERRGTVSTGRSDGKKYEIMAKVVLDLFRVCVLLEREDNPSVISCSERILYF
ncbi:coxsackievirus and adenovirus receptor homolog [Dunckerocampus dactyliophorus]|uniref:coxsackievirus and adenovirus receptor homolog n=1 Tax=Dunckerocampus dactyliophorus TaxID=161453 RepID=UPI002404CE8C|nr:coxsackievirus and adenovirus receptor homolog [Dunckerocampus dactyliophorus]XP_054643567.1 coxsackievirus and adenovirus receptor homolog [Dunckerocampus dactyliophorus]